MFWVEVDHLVPKQNIKQQYNLEPTCTSEERAVGQPLCESLLWAKGAADQRGEGLQG